MKTSPSNVVLFLALSLSLPASADIFGEIGKLDKANGFGDRLGYYYSSTSTPPTINFFRDMPQLKVLPGESAEQYIQRRGENGLYWVKMYAGGYFQGADIVPLSSESLKDSKGRNILFTQICQAAFQTGGNIPENLVREYAKRGLRNPLTIIENAYRFTLGRRPTISEVGVFQKTMGAPGGSFYSTFLQLHKNLIADKAEFEKMLDRSYLATMGRKATAADKAYWWPNRVQGESYANLCVVQRRWLESDNGLNDAVGAIQRAVRETTGGKVLPADSPNLLKLYGSFTNSQYNFGYDELQGWVQRDPKNVSDAVPAAQLPVLTPIQTGKFKELRLKNIKPVVPPQIKRL